MNNLNPGTKSILYYSVMLLIGLMLAVLLPLDFTFSLRSNLSILLFFAGATISIGGLHELCHVIYCYLQDIEIVGIHYTSFFKEVGIDVYDAPPELYLTSLFSIPITTICSTILRLPWYVILINTSIAFILCIVDIRDYLKKRQLLTKD